VWDARDAKQLNKFKPRGSPSALAVSPDGRTLAAAFINGVTVMFDATSLKPIRELQGHKGPVLALAFSPDGRTLASTAFQERVRLWRAASDEKVESTLGGP
jgi:WD40 repeat protein